MTTHDWKKPSAASLGLWLKLLLWALLLQVMAQQSASAQAYSPPCRISLQADPPLPANIATQQVIGTVLYQGRLTWKYEDCMAGQTKYLDAAGSPFVYVKTVGSYALLTGTSTPQPIWGVSGLTVQADPPVFGTNFIRTSDHQVNTSLSTQYNTYFVDSQLPNIGVGTVYSTDYWYPPVSFNLSQTITIKASATTVSGRFPDPKDGSPLIGLDSLGHFRESCRVGPWTLPVFFTACVSTPILQRKVKPWYVDANTDYSWPWHGNAHFTIIGVTGTKPLIELTPQVPTIGGSTTVVQDCKPVLRSSITIPNLKTP